MTDQITLTLALHDAKRMVKELREQNCWLSGFRAGSGICPPTAANRQDKPPASYTTLFLVERLSELIDKAEREDDE